jgi:hypothetical protein
MGAGILSLPISIYYCGLVPGVAKRGWHILSLPSTVE